MTSLQDWKRRLIFWAGALAVGVIAILFALASEMALGLFRKLVSVSPYLPLIITPLGLALAVVLTRRVFPGSQGSGIPQTIAVLEVPEYARDAMLSLRIAAGKILLTLLGLLSSASIGHEVSTVQIGASIMHSLGRFAHFPKHDLDKGLILPGGAAGIATAFPGGIFAPSLSAGAGFGAMIANIMPGVLLGAVVILGMVAYFSGVVQTPITAFVIVMEMTDNHGMILPLMAASFIAYAVSRIICPILLYQGACPALPGPLECDLRT